MYCTSAEERANDGFTLIPPPLAVSTRLCTGVRHPVSEICWTHGRMPKHILKNTESTSSSRWSWCATQGSCNCLRDVNSSIFGFAGFAKAVVPSVWLLALCNTESSSPVKLALIAPPQRVPNERKGYINRYLTPRNDLCEELEVVFGTCIKSWTGEKHQTEGIHTIYLLTVSLSFRGTGQTRPRSLKRGVAALLKLERTVDR